MESWNRTQEISTFLASSQWRSRAAELNPSKVTQSSWDWRQRWQDELNKLLLVYRNIPHSSTRANPAYLIFGRELRPNKSVLNENTRDPAWNRKLTSKVYADEQRNSVYSPAVPGGKVLLFKKRVIWKVSSKSWASALHSPNKGMSKAFTDVKRWFTVSAK